MTVVGWTEDQRGEEKKKRLTEGGVELMKRKVAVIVVVIVADEVLHGALQKAILQVLLCGYLY